jgi:hypothetical protein
MVAMDWVSIAESGHGSVVIADADIEQRLFGPTLLTISFMVSVFTCSGFLNFRSHVPLLLLVLFFTLVALRQHASSS